MSKFKNVTAKIQFKNNSQISSKVKISDTLRSGGFGFK